MTRRGGGARLIGHLLGGVLVGILLPAMSAVAGVYNTKHNLGSSGLNAASNFSGTEEICVFCHTPHGGDASAAVPIWNRQLDAGGFQTYDQMGTTTLDANVEPVGSVSIACLSCHDGSQAMDSVINEPGSLADNPSFSAGDWSGQAAVVQGRIGPVDVVTNLGKDLTNDHPVGIQYAGGGYSESYPEGRPRVDIDFNPPTSEVLSTGRVWWVDSREHPESSFSKRDLKLYSRVGTRGTNVGELQPYVECASCHDPHVDYNPTFLRIDPAGSAVCLTCHAK